MDICVWNIASVLHALWFVAEHRVLTIHKYSLNDCNAGNTQNVSMVVTVR